tara:strand:- start:284 stop:772 length:489 start_codon:yes stop_codon:yes gene_type:complete
MKENKRLKRLLGLLSQKVLTQSDIRSLKIMLGFCTPFEGFDQKEALNKMIKSCNGFDITEEHSDIGIEYLRKTFFKKNGDPRKAAFDDLTDHDINILRNFKKFKFVGFELSRLNHNIFNNNTNQCFEIVYRVIAKNGDWFDYLAVSYHSGSFEVLNRGAKNE